MPGPVSKGFTPILAAIKAQLMQVTQLPSERVHIVAHRRTTHMQGDQDILIRPGPIEWDKGFDYGAGRAIVVAIRTLFVVIRTRANLDISTSDDIRLTDPALGHIALEESVVDCLYCYLPMDVQGEALVEEPLHPLPHEEERRSLGQGDSPLLETRERGVGSDWIETELVFAVKYSIPLNQQGASY